MFDIYGNNDFGQGIWRDDFTYEQAWEAALACNVLHAHNERIRAKLDAKRREDELDWAWEQATKEDQERRDPVAFAAKRLAKLHEVHIGDCDGESCDCRGGTDCPHGWCQACALAAVTENRKKGADGTIVVKFGYHPMAVYRNTPDWTWTKMPDEYPD